MTEERCNCVRAYNRKGFDKRGYLSKAKSYDVEGDNPRAAAREVLQRMIAGRSKSTEIVVAAGIKGPAFFTRRIGIGGGGDPTWYVPATEEGVNSLPETIYPT